MNIALIFPRYKYVSGDVPLGVCYLAAYLRKYANLEIDVIDTTFHSDKDEINKVLNKKYDLVGISAMSSMIDDAFWIAKITKEKNPKTFVIIGGPHATVLPEETLKNPCIDAVCIGEGELTFAELVKNKGNPKGITGIWYKSGEGVIKNNFRKPIADLDDVPRPALDLVSMDKYIKCWFQMDSVKKKLKGVNIIASRGCPYNCSYCQPTLRRIFGQVVRKRSAKNIIEELKLLKEEYGIKAFSLVDDTFVFDRDWVMEFCDLLIKENLDLMWACNSRANLVNEQMFAKMKQAGLKKIYMGIESGTQRILDDIYHKGITLKQINDAVKILKKLKLRVQGYFMIGAPTETRKEVWNTIKLAISLPIDEATFSVTTPLPGTRLWDETKEKVSRRVEDFDYYKASVYKKGVTLPEKKINRLRRFALLSFYLSPKRLPNTIKGFLSVTEFRKSLMKLKRF
ncbi:B12-binding domain-containing radical SAM protein [Candidatus Woesearchaeota archaeon]|nr:B12-binding domain-containing radical SAM protein [Candidatus Woesearchaeota archaeon]